MIIEKAAYDYGFALAEQYKPQPLPELAVAGKSNVGKSSFINMLTNNSKLSRVGQTPGKTILINAFKINDSFYLMDFPGYGYAKVSNAEKKRWALLMEGYMQNSEALKGVILLIDIRNKPSEGDLQMIEWLDYYHVPFIVCATKADKLSASQTQKALIELSRQTGIILNQIIPVSSTKKTGKEQTLKAIEELLAR